MPGRSLEISAVSELVLAASLWGFGFVATVWALEDFGPLWIGGLRCSVAFVFGLLICLSVPGLRSKLSKSQFYLAFWPGLFLAGTLVLQTWGLKYTTATKSGFITTLYVLMVPILERALLGRKIPRFHIVFVLIALIGVAMICDLGQIFSAVPSDLSVERARELWNFGDWLTLICAFAATLHIVWFGKIHSRIESSFVFNIYQTFWAGLIPFTLMFFLEPFPTRLRAFPLGGLMMLTFASTLIAFALQVRAQKKVSPSLASLLFLLESPFAAFFGILFLGERLTWMNGTGALIILVSLASSVLYAAKQPKTVLIK